MEEEGVARSGTSIETSKKVCCEPWARKVPSAVTRPSRNRFCSASVRTRFGPQPPHVSGDVPELLQGQPRGQPECRAHVGTECGQCIARAPGQAVNVPGCTKRTTATPQPGVCGLSWGPVTNGWSSCGSAHAWPWQRQHGCLVKDWLPDDRAVGLSERWCIYSRTFSLRILL